MGVFPIMQQETFGELKMKHLLFLVLFFTLATLSCGAEPPAPSDKLINALIQVESSGNDRAVYPADPSLNPEAFGCLQIRQICLDDINKANGTNYKLTDFLGNRELSIWAFKRYMEMWATKKRLGRDPTDEDRARIWKGGPNGWKKEDSLFYWGKVKKELASKKVKRELARK